MDRHGREAIAHLPRFHVLPEQMTGGTVTLDREQAHKAAHVLRLRQGDAVGVMDGSGDCFLCRVRWLEKESGSLIVLERFPLNTEPPLDIEVCQAIPKGDKADTTIRACTEVGVSRFVLFPSKRTVARWPSERVADRLERLRAIARDAAEQAIRAKVPEVIYAPDLRLAVGSDRRVIFLYEECREPLLACLSVDNLPISLVIGPEGGFDDEEVRLAKELNWEFASLGPRVLRTEHAAVVAVATLLAAIELAKN